LLFHFTTAKVYIEIIEINAQLLFHFTAAKQLYNCKTNAQQQKKCTTAKQIDCNTNAEALRQYSTWEIIILLLFSLAFTLFCHFWHQHAITKIKGCVLIIGANIGSFAKSLCPYLWGIRMVVWTKQFVLYTVPGGEMVHTCSKNSTACNFSHTNILKPIANPNT
jgi:hypothetical protein